jgi:hypothetical protein
MEVREGASRLLGGGEDYRDLESLTFVPPPSQPSTNPRSWWSPQVAVIYLAMRWCFTGVWSMQPP